MYDVYGKFTTSWNHYSQSDSSIKPWLDPTNTGAVVNDGYDPNVTPYALDAGILNINAPTQTNYCNDTIYPVVVLRNFGSSSLNSVKINYQLDNGTPLFTSWFGTLASHGMTTINLPYIVPGGDKHLLKVYTSLPNGGTDLNTSNDEATVIFVTELNSFPIKEGFDNAVFPYQTWRIGNPDGNDTWFRNNAVGGFGNSSACAEYDNNYLAGDGYVGQYDIIYSPLIDFSWAISPIKFTFSVAYQQASATLNDSLSVGISTDCGSTWTQIYTKGGATLATVSGYNTSPFTPSNNQWRKDSVMLNSFVGHKDIMFAFSNYNGGGNDIYLDDINISIGNTGLPSIDNGIDVFNLYPNPTDGILKVSVSLTKYSSIVLNIMNYLGETVAAKTIDNTIGGSYTMDLSSLSQGIYYVQIKTNSETVVRKISLQK
jgi:hypothetical protein